MNKKSLSTAALLITTLGLTLSCQSTFKPSYRNAAEPRIEPTTLNYPKTHTCDAQDEYFGTTIADPYRWLEDDQSHETGEWVKSQNALTFDYLNKIPYRNTLKQRLRTLWNYEKVSAPRKEGQYTYFYKNDGLQNQLVVYRQQDNSEPEVFLDPNTFSQDGTTSLAQLSFSKDGSIAAYAISEGGSDWRKIIVIDVATKKSIGEPLIDVKFSDISWKGNDGFYYSSYDKPQGSELSTKTDQHKLYYHRLDTNQQQDQLVFGATKEQKRRYVRGYVTEDDRYLVITSANSTSGNELYLKDLTRPDSELITLLNHEDSDTYVIDNVGTQLYLATNLNAPNQKIVTVDARQAKPEYWQDLIKETEHVLKPSAGGGYFFAHYMVDANSVVHQYDYQGNKINTLKLPGLGTVTSLKGKKKDKTLYYTFTNYKIPRSIYQYDISKGESSIYHQSKSTFDSNSYLSKQVFYSSQDGTRIPMMITHKKGLKLNGNNPTILYGYGGFNISLTPYFSVAMSAWLEQGGIYAVANLRGGGEYGKKWHEAGTRLNKQNVFDDFIAAAQYLFKKRYTSRDYLAIYGRSNGGLLVAAVMTQRPDLMKVALPSVGVLDMLRYHTFTAGAGWAHDYGTAEQSKTMFEYLKGYSPVHNVKKGAHYPATLVTTADHDDRVVPAHSFKFAAELQAKQSGKLPTLIRIETNSGHGAGAPITKTIELYADILSFTLYNMGIEKLPVIQHSNTH